MRFFKDTASGDSIDAGVGGVTPASPIAIGASLGMKRKAEVVHSALKIPPLAEKKKAITISKTLEVSMCLSVLLILCVCVLWRGVDKCIVQ